MRKLLVTTALTLGILSVPALASTIPYYTGPIQAGNLVSTLNNLIGQINGGVNGLVAVQTSFGTTPATTNEYPFATTPIPGGTIGSPGQSLRAYCAGASSADTNNKTVTLYLGSFKIATGTMSTGSETWELELTLTNSGTQPSVVGFGRGSTNTTVVASVSTSEANDNLANSLTAKCTVTAGSAVAGEVTPREFLVEMVK